MRPPVQQSENADEFEDLCGVAVPLAFLVHVECDERTLACLGAMVFIDHNRPPGPRS